MGSEGSHPTCLPPRCRRRAVMESILLPHAVPIVFPGENSPVRSCVVFTVSVCFPFVCLSVHLSPIVPAPTSPVHLADTFCPSISRKLLISSDCLSLCHTFHQSVLFDVPPRPAALTQSSDCFLSVLREFLLLQLNTRCRIRVNGQSECQVARSCSCPAVPVLPFRQTFRCIATDLVLSEATRQKTSELKQPSRQRTFSSCDFRVLGFGFRITF